MSSETPINEIPLDSRQNIFRALVEAQDGGLSATASRLEIARQFSVTENDVKEIEREGLDNQWPPLE
jgi:hypothetical protein